MEKSTEDVRIAVASLHLITMHQVDVEPNLTVCRLCCRLTVETVFLGDTLCQDPRMITLFTSATNNVTSALTCMSVRL